MLYSRHKSLAHLISTLSNSFLTYFNLALQKLNNLFFKKTFSLEFFQDMDFLLLLAQKRSFVYLITYSRLRNCFTR